MRLKKKLNDFLEAFYSTRRGLRKSWKSEPANIHLNEPESNSDVFLQFTACAFLPKCVIF